MTRPGGRSLAALALAAVLGISGGALTAYVAQDDAGPVDAGPDPLALGVPLENVGCTGQTLVLLGKGDTANALRPSVADWGDVKYLEPAKSCDTAYPLVAGEVPKYVAYLPPYDTLADACEERMQSRHKGDVVTRMRAGNEDTVVCACHLDRTSLPQIGEGQDLTLVSGMWTYMYQRMLAELDELNPLLLEDFDFDRVQHGVFDEPTIDATRTFQTSIPLEPFGYVEEDTWAELRDRVCARYDY